MGMLNNKDEKILGDIFDMDLNEGPNISKIKYGLGDSTQYSELQELYNYINKLERLKYLEIEYDDKGEYCRKGGFINPKFENNVISIYNKKIHVSEKGAKYICELRRTKWDRVKGVFKSFLKAFLMELQGQIFKLIISFLLGTLFGSLGLSLIKKLLKV